MDSLKLKNRVQIRDKPNRVHTKNIKCQPTSNVHRWTSKRKKTTILLNTHPSKSIYATVRLAINVLDLDLIKPRHELPAVVQKWEIKYYSHS